MSADSFHSRVEGKMRSKAVLDWRDFLNLIRTCLTNPKNPIWHEAVAGRPGYEVAAAVLHLSAPQLPSVEYEHSVIWLDNCAGQSKNYILFSTLYNAVRTGIIPFPTLTVKFSVPGHTFMSADAFHAAVECNIKKNPVQLNIREFEERFSVYF